MHRHDYPWKVNLLIGLGLGLANGYVDTTTIQVAPAYKIVNVAE